jgi:hypothetical protein
MAKVKRFLIRTAAGDEPMDRAESPGAVLSKAITQAAASSEPGVWEVWEYEDLLYRVHRLDGKLDVRVEVVR